MPTGDGLYVFLQRIHSWLSRLSASPVRDCPGALAEHCRTAHSRKLSVSRYHFVQIQHQVAHHGPGSQLSGVQVLGRLGAGPLIDLSSGFEIGLVVFQMVLDGRHQRRPIRRSSGARQVACRNSHRVRPALSSPPSRSTRSPNALAHSTYCGSFINSSACSGVLVRSRRTQHASRDGASNVLNCGGGEVRLMNV